MKKTNKAKVFAVTLSLIIILALSATAFAEGPKGSPQMDRMQSGQQMNAPQDGMQMNGPRGDMQMNGPQGGFPTDRQPGDFSQDMQSGAPQGSFGENGGQLPPEKPEGEEPPVDGQQPPEKPEGEEGRTPPSDGENGFGPNGQMPRGDRDPMSQIFSAVNELEDEEVKANIESLMQAHRDAMDAERNAEDDDARAAAAEATAAARDALNEALTAWQIIKTVDMLNTAATSLIMRLENAVREHEERCRRVNIPEGLLQAAGIPKNAPLTIEADDGEIYITVASEDEDLTETLPSFLVELFSDCKLDFAALRCLLESEEPIHE